MHIFPWYFHIKINILIDNSIFTIMVLPFMACTMRTITKSLIANATFNRFLSCMESLMSSPTILGIKTWRKKNSWKSFSNFFLTQELSKTYPQNFCMSPNLFKLAWMKDPYGYMNLPEYGFPQGPYSPARAISKIGVYFGSKFSNCHIGLRFNLRSISFNV